jgi:hypothetical protein
MEAAIHFNPCGAKSWKSMLEKHVTKNAPCEAFFGQRRPTTKF